MNVFALLKEFCVGDDLEMSMMANKMKEKYDKYWGDPEKINLVILIVVVFDPRYKIDYVEWIAKSICFEIKGEFECFV